MPLEDLASAAAYVANFHFAAKADGYFADVTPSPAVHFWSLANEEQFYILPPLGVLLLAWIRRRPLAVRVAIVLVTATSLLLSWRYSATAPTLAYYSFPTRAWELGIGGILAMGWFHWRWLPAPVVAGLRALALVALMASVVLIHEGMAFPAWWPWCRLSPPD